MTEDSAGTRLRQAACPKPRVGRPVCLSMHKTVLQWRLACPQPRAGSQRTRGDTCSGGSGSIYELTIQPLENRHPPFIRSSPSSLFPTDRPGHIPLKFSKTPSTLTTPDVHLRCYSPRRRPCIIRHHVAWQVFKPHPSVSPATTSKVMVPLSPTRLQCISRCQRSGPLRLAGWGDQ